jgi:hypothetical protein
MGFYNDRSQIRHHKQLTKKRTYVVNDCKTSPRTFSQCCYQLRLLKVVEHVTFVCSMLIVLLRLLLASFNMGFINPANINVYIVQLPQGYTSCLFKILPLAFSVICRIYILRSPIKILICLVTLIVLYHVGDLSF